MLRSRAAAKFLLSARGFVRRAAKRLTRRFIAVPLKQPTVSHCVCVHARPCRPKPRFLYSGALRVPRALECFLFCSGSPSGRLLRNQRHATRRSYNASRPPGPLCLCPRPQRLAEISRCGHHSRQRPADCLGGGLWARNWLGCVQNASPWPTVIRPAREFPGVAALSPLPAKAGHQCFSGHPARQRP